jgi:SAM-dependent methyltransferase
MSQAWTIGDAYEPYIGRWSQLVARDFLEWLAYPQPARWVDIGCGTGALTRSIAATQQPLQVTGIDPSEAYLSFARQQLADTHIEFRLGDAEHLPLPDQGYDVAVSGLVFNFVPQPEQAAKEAYRVLAPQGWAAAYVWDYAEGMQLIRYFWDAVIALHPADQHLDEGRRFPLCHPDNLRELWQQAGFGDVATTAIEVLTPFKDFDDYWTPFLSGQGPAPKYCMDLTEEARGELREYLRAHLPTASDGAIQLTARAWAVRGHIR